MLGGLSQAGSQPGLRCGVGLGAYGRAAPAPRGHGTSTEASRSTCHTGAQSRSHKTMSPLLELSISAAAREYAESLDVAGLYERASAAIDRAHAPYSGFRVGAAVLTESGRTITGSNVENGSYGLTICAERVAIVRAVAEGHTDLAAISVATDSDRVQTVAPCGACLQVMAEFDPDDRLVVAFPERGQLRVACLSDLLPVRFRLETD